MTENFKKDLVKKYKHWEVYVHKNQGYLGRCVVWCKRSNAKDLTDATPKEQSELFLVLRNLKKSIKETFQPDWLNYSFLGNKTRHLHAQIIPRYKKPKIFMGITFKDKFYGHNYKTDHSFKTSAELLTVVKNKLKAVL